MNILYISHLTEGVASGLNFSVPAGIKAQCNYDNVMWVDISEASWPSWQAVPAYHNAKDFGGFSLDRIPSPFNHPDVVVFEGFYELDDVKIASVLRKRRIPYIIIPRGSLTYSAMHNQARWKKKLAHFLFFDKYVKKALAIQFLTEKEYDDSKYRFDYNHYIIPNGFDKQSITKQCFSKNVIKAIFIGRLDKYHKGLDFLFNVLEKRRDELEKAGFFLTLYGPELYDYEELKNRINDSGLSKIAVLGGAIAGEDKKKAILESDVFIMTSRFEGHPMGLIEALAYGLPTLVTRGSNMLEEIKAANAGWVCETDEQSIEQALMQMINEKESFMEKSKNAINLALQYDWDNLASRFHDKLIELINK